MTLSDGTSLKLNYWLLPSFVADRLQGSLLSDYSTWMRLQYDIDGLKLFMQRPLLGYGLGSTEAWLGSVQPYYYESAYVHNHLIQSADDMGIVGLLSLLALMGGTAWLLLRRLRKESDALAAMLLACWAMMNLHGLMELNFSIRAYQCAAFFLLAAVIALYGTPLLKKEPGRFVRYTAAGLSVVYLVTYGVLVWNNWAVNREREEFTTTSAVAYLSALESFAQRNVLDPEDLQLRYVAQAVTMELDEGQQATMLSYVDTLRGSGTYIACTGLAQMYYLPRESWKRSLPRLLRALGRLPAMRMPGTSRWTFTGPRCCLLPEQREQFRSPQVSGSWDRQWMRIMKAAFSLWS